MKNALRFNKLLALLVTLIFLTNIAKANQTITNGKIVFVSNRSGSYEIYTMNFDGTSLNRITNNNEDEFFPKWSPDGTKVLFYSTSGIYTINSNGSGLTNILTNGSEPAWSSDGQEIVYTLAVDGTTESDIWIMNLSNQTQTKIVDKSSGFINSFPVWIQDLNIIAYVKAEYRVTQFSSDLRTVNLTTGIQTSLGRINTLGSPRWSKANNKLVFYDLGIYHEVINILDVNSLQISTLTQENNTISRSDQNPTWSPDGQYIVFDSQVYPKRDRDIFVMTTSGTGIINLTGDSVAQDIMPDWQPVLIALPTPTPSPSPTPAITCNTTVASGNNAALISAIQSGTWCG